jgi:hypothetical protein
MCANELVEYLALLRVFWHSETFFGTSSLATDDGALQRAIFVVVVAAAK